MVLVTKEQWEILQKMQAETKPILTEDQKTAMVKIARDLNRYERKRRVAARMIAKQKIQLCVMAADLNRQNKKWWAQHHETRRLTHEKDVLIERINDLTARLADERETVCELNDEIERLKGRVEGVGWAFEHK